MPKRDCTGGLSRILPQILVSCLLCASTTVSGGTRAAGAAEDVATAPGATLRLHMLAPDGAGRVRAALEVDLQSGWKTYWTQPGPVGLAPTLDGSASRALSGVTVLAPAPKWFREGDDQSAGYLAPMAFAIEADATASDPLLRIDAMIGLCREICVPFAASLEARPVDGLSARAAVNAAFEALPTAEAAPAGWSAELTPDRTSLRVTLPRGEAADDAALFLAGPTGWSFDAPTRREGTGDVAVFDVPVLRQAEAGEPLRIDGVLTSGASARSFHALPLLLP